MNEEQQRRQIELSINVNEQEQKHSVETLDPNAVAGYIQQSRQQNQTVETRRQQIWGEQVQQPVAVQQAAAPVQQPVAAPVQETYKEKKERLKREKQQIKEGQRYTPNANIYTSRLMRLKAANDPNGTGPAGLPRGMDAQALKAAVVRITEAKITPDMFSDTQFPAQSVLLRRSLYEFKSIERIMTENPAFFNQLQQTDPLRAQKLQHCKNLIRPLEDMLALTSATHGITVEGAAINEAPIVSHARNVKAEALAHFARQLDDENAAYSGEIQQYIDQRIARQLPQKEQEQQTFRQNYVAAHPESAWANNEAFNSPIQFETMEKVRTLITEHTDVYMQNKALVDSMFDDILHSLEAISRMKTKAVVCQDIEDSMHAEDAQLQDSQDIAWSMGSRIMEQTAELNEVTQRFENVNDAMKVFLRGGELNGLNVAVLSQFGYDAQPQFRQRIMDDASVTGVRSQWQNDTLERLLQNPAVHVGDHTSQFVKRSASMLRQNDDAYNIALLNHLELVKNLGDNIPDKAFYDQTRAMLKPFVDKIMDWDVDGALQMNQNQLTDALPQLDSLFGENMFVADLLKTKHWYNGDYTMKEELLGDKLELFGHKIAVLRALYEKSRGLALKRAAKLGDIPQTAFSQVEWQSKVHDNAGVLPFAEERLSIGERLLQTENSRYNDLQDVNSDAFKQKCKGMVETALRTHNFHHVGQFKAVEDEFNEAFRKMESGQPLTDEERQMANAIMRVREKSYCLAAYTQEEAQRDGAKVSIGEAVFRAFGRFTESESGRQLTAEQFKRLVLDLGAGEGMEHGVTPEAEITEAREKNMRGIRQYKESMRVQYDYLSKKYGSSVERLDIKYIYDHYFEIMRDFANPQADTSMMSGLPGFFDMNDPADVRLMHQAEYYALMGVNAINMISQYGMMHMPQEMIYSTAAGLGEAMAPHKDYLTQHTDDCPFGDRLNPDAVMQQQRIVD